MQKSKLVLDENLLNSISTAIYIIDGQGNYIFCNNAFIKHTKGTKDQILGTNAFDLIKRGEVKISAGVEAIKTKKIFH